jgi:hypothetical protein
LTDWNLLSGKWKHEIVCLPKEGNENSGTRREALSLLLKNLKAAQPDPDGASSDLVVWYNRQGVGHVDGAKHGRVLYMKLKEVSGQGRNLSVAWGSTLPIIKKNGTLICVVLR